MADVKEQRIFCADQIQVPDAFPGILKNFSKQVIRGQLQDRNEIISFAKEYFMKLDGQRCKHHYNVIQNIKKQRKIHPNLSLMEDLMHDDDKDME